MACSRCGGRTAFLMDICDACLAKAEVERRVAWDAEQREAVERREHEELSRRRAARVVVSTTEGLAGHEVVRTLGIVTAECAFGMSIFRDFFAGVTDILGGRSEATQRVLRDARETCLRELRREAHALGGNAVVGVRLDYSEFSGQGKSMLFLVATGTAVVVTPEPPAHTTSD